MKNMNNTIKIITAFVFVFGFVGCEPYEEYVYDYKHSAVCFGAQQPVRTLVARTGSEYLEFRIGAALGGLRENKKGYTAKFEIDPELLEIYLPDPPAPPAPPTPPVPFTLLPADCYTIENSNNTFVIAPGTFLGDCPVKIDKAKFVALPGSLVNTYALPLRLLSTDADSIMTGRGYTVIVIKYIDEHSGDYYCKGQEAEWDGTAIVPETKVEYSHVDLIKNKIRTLTTLSLTQFDMAGMGSLAGIAAVDHLLVNLVSGEVTLETKAGCNAVENLGSSYNTNKKTFTLNYIYTKGGKSYLVSETLELRLDVERELRFETW